MSVNTSYGYETSTKYLREQAEKEALSTGKVTHSDFLKLLTTQLTTQDPLNPMQDIDFTAQLAQLQALDEQMAMTKSMQAMRLDTQLQAGTAMIGKYISGTDPTGTPATGLVSRVVQADGSIYLELANKQRVEVTSVGNVWNDADGMYRDLAASGNIIGMWVEAGTDSSGQAIRGIVEKVAVKDGMVTFTLYGGKTVTQDQIQELRAPTEAEIFLYTFPDNVRADIEKAYTMVDKGITGIDADGNRVNGIVADAVVESMKVYLVLYSGEKIAIADVEGEARKPTADDAAKSLAGYWAVGLDTEGMDAEGIIVDAVEHDDGMAVVLADGRKIYFEFLKSVREATVEEKEASGL